MPRDMRSCSQSTVCPNCKHKFACCDRRSLSLSGGGLVGNNSAVPRLAPPQPIPGTPQANLVSPSSPLTFSFPVPLQYLPPPQAANQDAELQHLRDTVQALHQSGWFYEGITFQDSQDMLKNTKVGTFLVRNSSNPKFLFSLSVQTERGPTSVRLHYINGYFSLEAQPHLLAVMPAFPNVIDLIRYYVLEFKRHRTDANVWVDTQGKWHSAIKIDKPLRKKEEPPSLKHFARLAIHKAIQSSGKHKIALQSPHKELKLLPNCLISYLGEYPHAI
ncbi:suppressor of cytokine signaling 2-like [Euwallacea fornicatus]|uniref:suppressor of cytokine signaling 2-like n=1 Tax=Euwallacea fornicatus TaxID=995702 RepID=UPI00338E98F9